MKKSIISLFATLIFSILLCCSVSASRYGNDGEVRVTLPSFRVEFNGVVVDNIYSQYPSILYNDITYFPMTYNDSRFLGIESNYTYNSGLEVFSGVSSSSVYQPYFTKTPNARMYTATLPKFRITVNGTPINNETEEYPLLVFQDITYFPLTWRFAVEEFGWYYRYDATEGLIINSTMVSGNITAYEKLKNIILSQESKAVSDDYYCIHNFYDDIGDEYNAAVMLIYEYKTDHIVLFFHMNIGVTTMISIYPDKNPTIFHSQDYSNNDGSTDNYTLLGEYAKKNQPFVELSNTFPYFIDTPGLYDMINSTVLFIEYTMGNKVDMSLSDFGIFYEMP